MLKNPIPKVTDKFQFRAIGIIYAQYTPNDAEQLTNCIVEAIQLKNDKTKWDHKKKMCFKRIEKQFSIKKMKENYENLWNN